MLFNFVENTISNSANVARVIFGKWWTLLFYYPDWPSSRTLLQGLPTCLNFASDAEDVFCGYTNKLSNFYGSIKATENHEDDRSLTLYFRWALSTSIPTCIHSQKSVFIFSFLKIGHVLNQVPPSHNCKTMHMTNEILSNYKKIAPHREIARIDWVFQVCLT